MKYHLILCLILIQLLTTIGFLHAQAPSVSNVVAAQRTDGSKIIDIYYDLSFPNPCTVNLTMSDNEGFSFHLNPTRPNLSGDVGEEVLPGIGKHIIWNAGNETFELQGDQYRFRVMATYDYSGENTFIYIPAGNINIDGTVYHLSAYYADKYEVTQGSFLSVMRFNPSHGLNIGSDYPVYNTTWFDAIEYCNRRSMTEGFSPCYSYGSYGTNPDTWPSTWNSQNDDHLLIQCNWQADGYRLLSEVEWLYAGRGGSSSNNYTYSGSNTLDLVAWYDQNSYLLPPQHPDHGIHPVGNKAGNELGFYDMTGNLYEWCWDIYSSYSYGSVNDPHGATTGTHRVVKGAGWKSTTYGCQIRIRCIGLPLHTGDGDFGFRIGRSRVD